jgi:hypothetical protein
MVGGGPFPPTAKHAPEPGEWGLFTCRGGHEWVARLPSWSAREWPHCIRCGQTGYLRKQLWHRVGRGAQAAGVVVGVYALVFNELTNPGLLVASVGLILFQRVTQGRWI